MSSYETDDINCLTNAILHVAQAKKHLQSMPKNLADHEIMELTETIRTLSLLGESIRTGEIHSW